MSLLTELTRRRVFMVGAPYLVIARLAIPVELFDVREKYGPPEACRRVAGRGYVCA